MLERRNFLRLAGGATAAAAVPWALVRSSQVTRSQVVTARRDLQLVPRPSRLFRITPDFNRDRVERWRCYLRLTSDVPEAVTIEQIVVTERSQGIVRIVETHDAAAAAALTSAPAPAAVPAPPPYVIAVIRIASTRPQSLALDSVDVQVVARLSTGEAVRAAHALPIETYSQRTRLVFPFEGPGIIVQGGAANDGHRNASGLFAVDALGLSDMYAAMAKHGDTADSLAGWGRPIVAPATGVVVVARGDRPDQPTVGNADPKLFVPEFPDGGDPGNHVVLDHRNGEFSMIAHLQRNSVAVSVGQRVDRGQRLGLLGNSGDSTSPHVHHQLQNGPDWTTADGLPHVYENGPQRRHDRGWMFNARSG